MKKKLLFLIPAFVGMSVFAQTQQKVGVNTDAPQATLDINGNMAIEKVRTVKENETVSPLGWDPSDKKVKQIISSDHFIYSLDYRIECTTSGGKKSQKNQWVANFDTKIPYDKFNLIFGRVLPVDRDYNFSHEIDIMHSDTGDGGGKSFTHSYEPTIEILDYPYALQHSQTITYTGNGEDKNLVNPVLRKVLWKDESTKTWHLSVGYVDARPDNAARHSIYYEWNVQVLAISNEISDIKEISLRKVSDEGGNSDNTIDLKNNPFQ